MGCSTSYQEPPRQQPSTKTAKGAQRKNSNPGHGKQSKVNGQSSGTSLSRETLIRYIELEREIHLLEGKNIIKAVQAKAETLERQKQHCETLTATVNELIAVTKKEKADVDQLEMGGVGDLLANNEVLAQEKEEYIDALNKEEIARLELAEAKRQAKELEVDLAKMKTSAEHINNLYDEQEDLLSKIFSGDYGSEAENKLENELDLLIDRKQRISVAKYKWQNTRVLIQYSTNQLAFAVKKWIQVGNTPATEAKARYTIITEVRNNLVAAIQNITSAQRYLINIKFPYCKPPEMATLTNAANNIYSDVLTADRHAHALNVYNVTHKRAAALLNWFDHVIKNMILKDAAEANKAALDKERELNAERVMLIKEKVRAELGEEVDLNFDTAGGKMEEDDNVGGDQEIMALAARTGGEGEEDITKNDDQPQGGEDAPMDEDKLADAPSIDDLFGDIDDLKKQHEKDMAEYNRQQDLNKARVDQGLQEKLKNRRSRRRHRDN